MAAWTDVVSWFAEAARCCALRVPDADEAGGELGVPGAPARGQRESAWARGRAVAGLGFEWDGGLSPGARARRALRRPDDGRRGEKSTWVSGCRA